MMNKFSITYVTYLAVSEKTKLSTLYSDSAGFPYAYPIAVYHPIKSLIEDIIEQIINEVKQ